MSLANKITIVRVLLIPVMMFFLLNDAVQPEGVLIAAVIFALAAISDTADGYVARAQRTVTRLGKFMDPLADKLLISAALVSLVEMDRVAAWVVMIIIAREFIVTGLRLVAAAEEIVISASTWGKIKTVTQVIAVIALMLSVSKASIVINIESMLLGVAVLATVASGVDYFIKFKRLMRA